MMLEEWKCPNNLNAVDQYTFGSDDEIRSSSVDVTVGIPTYKRPHLLRRAIQSVSNQTYRDFHLVISSNEKSSAEEIIKICDEFAQKIKRITLYVHHENIGSLGNFKFLLDFSDTEFFMWLADDDEISENYIRNLREILRSNPNLSSAMGLWVVIDRLGNKRYPRQPDLSSRNLMIRLFNFIVANDDSWYYGLHRKDKIQKCDFEGYFWPNKGIVTNWCYVFLFEILINSPVYYSKSVEFINYDYGERFYPRANYKAILRVFGNTMRRANVYILYAKKLFKGNHYFLGFILILVSLNLLVRDVFLQVFSKTKSLISKYNWVRGKK